MEDDPRLGPAFYGFSPPPSGSVAHDPEAVVVLNTDSNSGTACVMQKDKNGKFTLLWSGPIDQIPQKYSGMQISWSRHVPRDDHYMGQNYSFEDLCDIAQNASRRVLEWEEIRRTWDAQKAHDLYRDRLAKSHPTYGRVARGLSQTIMRRSR